MARSRTTKTLAKRIELDYFQKPQPFRTWRRRLTLAAAVAAATAVALALLPAGRSVWSAGSLTAPHALFDEDCGACHGPEPAVSGPGSPPIASAGGSGIGAVHNDRCVSCHLGPVHDDDQTHLPRCASCHREHRGRPLHRVRDTHCTSCHAVLTTRSGNLQVAARVRSFPEEHPEFAAVARGSDPGRLRLNHRLHLKGGLQGPDGPVTLTCAACHRAEPSGRRIQPVRYADHCASCHPLVFDTEDRFPGAVVPHGDPSAARDFLVDLYAASVVETPEATQTTDPVAAALARHRERHARPEATANVRFSEPSRTAPAFVVGRVALAVDLLERQTCALCHGRARTALHDELDPGGGTEALRPPPDVPRADVVSAWYPRARFSHRAHRALDCTACHGSATDSEQTADLLLPGLETCAACHRADRGAPSDCATCHRYHPSPDDPLQPGQVRHGLPGWSG